MRSSLLAGRGGAASRPLKAYRKKLEFKETGSPLAYGRWKLEIRARGKIVCKSTISIVR